MKAKEFSESLTNVDDKYIEEAAAAVPKAKQPASKTSAGLKAWRAVAIAASAVLVTGITLLGLGAAGAFDGAGASYNYVKEEEYYAPAYQADGGALYEEAAYENGSGGALEVPVTEGAGGTMESVADVNAKIIYTAYINLESTEFDKSYSAIEDLVKRCGGYFQNRSLSNHNGSYRTASMDIRIPVAQYGSFLEDISGTATVITKNENAEDVSEDYYDIESRLTTAKTKLKRLNQLLAEAENLEDIITIESSISETEWVVDSLQGALNNYDSRIEYSTVSISLEEVYSVKPNEAPKTFGERIAKSFTEGLADFGEAMGDIAVWFAGAWLWLLFILAINAAIIIIIVVSVKKKNKKRAETEE